MKVLSQYLPVLCENKTVVNRKFLNLHPLQISYSYFLVLRAQPPVLGSTNGGGRREKTFYIFQKVAIRKTIFAYILEKSALGKLGFFPSCPYDLKEAGNRASKLPESEGNMKPQQGEFSKLNFLLCFFLHPVVKPFGMNLTRFPFNFYFKITPLCPWYQSKKENSTPVITIIGVPFTVLTFGDNREF